MRRRWRRRPFLWGCKCLVTIFFGSIVTNIYETYCNYPPRLVRAWSGRSGLVSVCFRRRWLLFSSQKMYQNSLCCALHRRWFHAWFSVAGTGLTFLIFPSPPPPPPPPPTAHLECRMSSSTFLMIWGWILIGPLPFKSLKPVFGLYGLLALIQFIWAIIGTAWYRLGRLPCQELVPELTAYANFEIVTFWISFVVAAFYIIRWRIEIYQEQKKNAFFDWQSSPKMVVRVTAMTATIMTRTK